MSDSEIQARVAATRAELETTLDAIEDKLNVPKQLGRAGRFAEESFDENPVPWIVGAVIVAGTVVGLVAWALFSKD
ncbi:MAG: hypothetical protein JWQ43_2204 [Glaciihabitans sp.]|nr:hypothetical protein [Glaciihabitans sp.]